MKSHLILPLPSVHENAVNVLVIYIVIYIYIYLLHTSPIHCTFSYDA